MGGEKIDAAESVPGVLGSPPRGRGKDPDANYPALPGRITPAWAGKSSCRFILGKLARDHPRVGGEKVQAACLCIAQVGSPPRGRGKDFVFPPQNLGFRITPAWAGKSEKLFSIIFALKDHPRVGGEKI